MPRISTFYGIVISMYFSDPWGNEHEITTYDGAYARERLSGTA